PNIDLNILVGDVVDSGHIYSQWDELFKAANKHFANNMWMSAIGNHETNYNGEAFTGYFYGPNNGVESNFGARNYWFEINDAIVFNFDTEAAMDSYDPNYEQQIELLNQVMKNSNKSYKIVVMHRS